MSEVNRRTFLTLAAVAPMAARFQQGRAAAPVERAVQLPPAGEIPASFPRQDPAVAKEIVGASHGNVLRVKELVSARPALARAAWEWGYGDWETALGAASHVGNRDIAAILLAAGAHPTIFSAAMLGQLEIVKGFVAASPGIQRTRGPHGISLLDHAKAGGSDDVVRYLERLGDAHPTYPREPLAAGDPAALVGAYVFGRGASDRLLVSVNERGALVARREGEPDRMLFHHGGRTFNPSGAEAVRLTFEPSSGRAVALHVADGPVRLRAVRD